MKNPTLLAAAALLATTACSMQEYETVYAVHANYTVADSYDVDVESGGTTTTTSPDYESIQGGLLYRYEDAEGTPVLGADFVIGVSDFGDADATEFAGGLRWYLLANPTIKPWVGVYGVYTIFGESTTGEEPGEQFGIAPAAGVEWEFTERFFLEAQVDYNVVVSPAESDVAPSYDTEAGGMAVRIGIGWDF